MSRVAVGPRLLAVRDGFRTKLWPLPVLGVLAAVALGIGLPHLDGSLGGVSSTFLFSGGPSAARTLLGAIATSLITVTSLTFSLTVVTLQLASSQFSPRLLRTFTRDRFVHATLALFLATFTFALAVLRSVRDSTEAGPQFVPQVSVTLAFVLAVASVLGLVLFLAHLAREIRVETMLRRVHAEARETIRRVLPEPEAEAAPVPDGRPEPPADALPILAPKSGFLVGLDEDEILAAAVEAGAVVVLDRSPGSSLVAGTPVGVGWPLGEGFEPDARERLCERVAAAIATDFERTSVQDFGYGLRQLTDVTIKALSPGINDPTTAVHALGHTSALLSEMGRRDLGDRFLRDADGRVRVVLGRPGFAAVLDAAMTQPRHYGAGDPFVMARLFATLGELAWDADHADRKRTLADQLRRLEDTVAAQDFDPAERERLEALAVQVQVRLDRAPSR